MRFHQLTIKRNPEGEFEAWNELGETTGVLTLGELLEQVIALYSGGMTRAYTMQTPVEWATRRDLARERARSHDGEPV